MGGLFKSPPPPPKPKPPPPMPDERSPALEEAKRRQAADALSRQGRSSTILTSPGQRGGGGGDYGSSKLGEGG
jgi:hypothetical protein